MGKYPDIALPHDLVDLDNNLLINVSLSASKEISHLYLDHTNVDDIFDECVIMMVNYVPLLDAGELY